jgi:hypothetical protein
VLNFLQAPRPIKGELRHRASRAAAKSQNGKRRKQAA